MTAESPHGKYRLYSLDHRHDVRRGALRSFGATSPGFRQMACIPGAGWVPSTSTRDLVAHQGSPRWSSSVVPLTGRKSRRAEKGHFAPLMAIRRIVDAIGLWRRHARSRQQLRELSDHLLKDIGLRREDFGSEFPKPFGHCD